MTGLTGSDLHRDWRMARLIILGLQKDGAQKGGLVQFVDAGDLLVRLTRSVAAEQDGSAATRYPAHPLMLKTARAKALQAYPVALQAPLVPKNWHP